MDIDPYENDPGRWGASMANNAELMLGALDAAQCRSVAEVGAYAGDLTRIFLKWAEPRGATVVAIDAMPQPPLEALVAERDDLTLFRGVAAEALREIELPDAVVIDGDHNYYAVTNELRLIAERAGDDPLPLLLFHDVGWPHARRDLYYDLDDVPAEARHPAQPGGGLFPGEPGIRRGGLPMPGASAKHEGGPRNGVLTAIEDFIAARGDLRLAVVPAFFGLGFVWSRDAPYADALAELLDPWDRNPLLERLEANRVLHLCTAHFQWQRAEEWKQRDGRKGGLLGRLLESNAFAVGQLISRIRQRGEPAFSKAEARALLEESRAAYSTED